MCVFYFFAVFLLILRLRKSFKFSPLQLKWNTIFAYALWGTAIVFTVSQIYIEEEISTLLGSALLLGVVLYIDKEPDFSNFRSYSRAHYP